ncbi:MAG: hypothetical protein ACRD1T_10505, partial [Acidimicrobiia bacterium]
GQLVRLQPAATGPRGEQLDDDWIVLAVGDDAIRLAHSRSSAVASVGLDHVSSYFSDATRSTEGQRYGFLQLHSQIRFDAHGQVIVEPLPPPRLRRTTSFGVASDDATPRSSTLAALHASGVSFTGGEWERPFARKLLDEALPLRVTIELIRNIGSGATPGMWIRGTNHDAEEIRDAAFKLVDVVLWNDSVWEFVKTKDIHHNPPFVELETGTAHLFCSQPADLGFIRVEQIGLRIDGTRDGGRDQCRISTPGIWKLVGRIVAPDGRRGDAAVCFQWDGKGIPIPVECPSRGQ